MYSEETVNERNNISKSPAMGDENVLKDLIIKKHSMENWINLIS